MASSRGADLEEILQGEGYHVQSHVISGGTLQDIIDLAEKTHFASPTHTTHTENNTHVYIIAGVPDITELIHLAPKHKECIYNSTPEKNTATP